MTCRAQTYTRGGKQGGGRGHLSCFEQTLSSSDLDKAWGLLVVPWLRLPLLMQREQVQSLLGKLRSPMPCGQNPKHKTEAILLHSIKTLKIIYIQKKKKPKILKKAPRMSERQSSSSSGTYQSGNQMPIFLTQQTMLLLA